MNNMKVAAVIVNYNDSNRTIELAKILLKYTSIYTVIVVDNDSKQSELIKLTNIKNTKFCLIKNNANIGYGGGNNLGILKADSMGCKLCLIINPDVVILESTIEKLVNCFNCHKNALIVAPSTVANGLRVAWHINGIQDLVLTKLKIFSKITKKPFYSNNYYHNKKETFVDAVLGACLMIDIEKFKKIGLYDSNIFLYEEENYLAIQCKRFKYDTILLSQEYYIHNHKDDNAKSFKQQLKSKKLVHNSLLYLTSNYCHYSKIKNYSIKLFLKIAIFEFMFLFMIKKIL